MRRVVGAVGIVLLAASIFSASALVSAKEPETVEETTPEIVATEPQLQAPATEPPIIEPVEVVEETEPQIALESVEYESEEVVYDYGVSDEDAIAYIVNHESGGDPFASNGKYKGIGQLDQSYYPGLVGKTWEECEGDADIQNEAMMAYIDSHYGGDIQAAYQSTVTKGWY